MGGNAETRCLEYRIVRKFEKYFFLWGLTTILSKEKISHFVYGQRFSNFR